MSFTNFDLKVGADGIALVAWDMPGRSMNIIDATPTAELSAIVEQSAADAAVKGAVITSGKASFCAGAFLSILQTMNRLFVETVEKEGEEAANALLFAESRKFSQLCRRLETC